MLNIWSLFNSPDTQTHKASIIVRLGLILAYEGFARVYVTPCLSTIHEQLGQQALCPTLLVDVMRYSSMTLAL